MSVKDIVEGHLKMIFSIEDEMAEGRIDICKKCPLCVKDTLRGLICTSKLYLNPQTDEASLTPKDGWVRGCNCTLDAKTRLRDSACVVEKW